MNKNRVIKAIQEGLIRSGYDLGPAGADGVMGPRTAAMMSRPEVATALSQSVSQTVYPEVKRPGSWISEQKLASVIAEASERFSELEEPRAVALADAMRQAGLTPESYLLYLVDLEAAVPQKGFKDAVSVAPSGLFHGLTQMGFPSWTDARSIDPSIGPASTASTFSQYVYDPFTACYGALLYAAANWYYTENKVRARLVRRPKASAPLLYFMHNIGHTAVSKIADGSFVSSPLFKGQSREARQEYFTYGDALKKELTYG